MFAVSTPSVVAVVSLDPTLIAAAQKFVSEQNAQKFSVAAS